MTTIPFSNLRTASALVVKYAEGELTKPGSNVIDRAKLSDLAHGTPQSIGQALGSTLLNLGPDSYTTEGLRSILQNQTDNVFNTLWMKQADLDGDGSISDEPVSANTKSTEVGRLPVTGKILWALANQAKKVDKWPETIPTDWMNAALDD